MKKKLDTRFPAARIKKIMQADEDVGKIAMAVPVLVSKALELFLQDLCDRTYDITLRRGAKTVNSLHLKHCVQSYNVFDFLREVVSKVPDYGHSDAAAAGAVSVDDRTMVKRKKTAADETNESDEELKRNRMNEARQTGSNGRGRGRGRGRSRGRGRGSAEREAPQTDIELESSTSLIQPTATTTATAATTAASVVSDGGRDFDLNAGVDENMEKASDGLDGGAPPQQKPPPPPPPLESVPSGGGDGVSEALEVKNEDYLGTSLSEMDRMVIDTGNLGQINSRLDEEDEDYDEE